MGTTSFDINDFMKMGSLLFPQNSPSNTQTASPKAGVTSPFSVSGAPANTSLYPANTISFNPSVQVPSPDQKTAEKATAPEAAKTDEQKAQEERLKLQQQLMLVIMLVWMTPEGPQREQLLNQIKPLLEAAGIKEPEKINQVSQLATQGPADFNNSIYGANQPYGVENSSPEGQQINKANQGQYVKNKLDNAIAPPLQGAPTQISGNKMNINPTEANRLVLLSVMEAPTKEGRLDVANAVINRYNAKNAGGANYGDSLTEVMFAPGQFEPFFGTSASQINSKEDAVAMLMSKRGMSQADATKAMDETLANMQNPEKMAASAQFVGGRTDFKGVTQYGNMHAGEDKLRADGENFFHIGDNQSYDLLKQIAAKAPAQITIG
jgi:hypothetical protein